MGPEGPGGRHVEPQLTSISFELLPGNVAVAGTMGLLMGGAGALEMLGETGSTLTMAGAELRQTDGERTTAGGDDTVTLQLQRDHLNGVVSCCSFSLLAFKRGTW